MKEAEDLVAKAKRFLGSAEALLAAGDVESSVSRTYYAMFHAAQAALLTGGRSYSSHGGVVGAFGEHFVKTGVFPREMGRDLNRAQEKRQLADYGHEVVIGRDEAEQLLGQGKEFVGRIEEHLRASGHMK